MLKIEKTRFVSLNKKSNIRLHNFCHQFEKSEIAMPLDAKTFLLVYIKKGLARMSVNDSVLFARSGDIIVTHGSADSDFSFFVYENQSSPDYYILHMTDIDEWIPSDACPVVSPTPPPEIISSKFLLLESELMSQKNGWEDICCSTLNVLMRLLNRDLRPLPAASTVSISRSDMLFNQILDYVHIHYCEKITLQSVSDFFYISPYYLSHLFEKKKSVSLIQYITHLRIHEAKMLLRTTDYPVRQIAQMTGYQNANYFFNVFKSKTGMSPNEYRTENAAE